MTHLAEMITEYEAINDSYSISQGMRQSGTIREIGKFGLRISKVEEEIIELIKNIERLISNRKGDHLCCEYKFIGAPFPSILSNPSLRPELRIPLLKIMTVLLAPRLYWDSEIKTASAGGPNLTGNIFFIFNSPLISICLIFE
jgi:hypothetical protein